jgi:hypothetical protein
MILIIIATIVARKKKDASDEIIKTGSENFIYIIYHLI